MLPGRFPVRIQSRAQIRSYADAGFTLVELVMVIVILGLLAVVAVPRLSMGDSFRTTAFRDEVVAALRYAHKAAVSHRRLVCVTIDSRQVAIMIAATNPASACSAPLNGPTGETAAAEADRDMITAGSAEADRDMITAGLGTIFFHTIGSSGPSATSIGDHTLTVKDEMPIVVTGATGHVK